MLQTLDSEIRECYRHARECSRSADQSRDSLTKQDFLDMERRWLCLAHSYEFTERLWNLNEPFRKRKRQKFNSRAILPSCRSAYSRDCGRACCALGQRGPAAVEADHH
jgi:hypothetical protein